MRAPSPCDVEVPLLPFEERTSPECTVIETSTRPLGERASTAHGNGGSPVGDTGSIWTPGATVTSGCPFTTNVTTRAVLFEMLSGGSVAPGLGNTVA
jgi:hypothetical protein